MAVNAIFGTYSMLFDSASSAAPQIGYVGGCWDRTPRPVLRIRIRIHRIHVFLGLQDPDPDPVVRGMDPDPDPALDPDPDPSIIMQKSKKNLDSSYFVTLFEFYL